MTYLLPKTMQTLVSGDVDLTTAGATLLFTTPPLLNFICILLSRRGIDLDTVTVDATINIGSNAPDYDNILSGGAFFLTTTDTVNSSGVDLAALMSSSSDIYVNVIVPMVAVSGIGKFYIGGLLDA